MKKAILYFIILSIISSKKLSLFSKQRKIYLKLSTIKLKIYASGTHNIFYSGSDSYCPKDKKYPDEVHINGVKKDVKSKYYFEKENSIVLLKWKENLKMTNCLFMGCSTINEIDLSEFESSEITTMPFMFRFCSSLNTINIINFNTNKVTDMGLLFDGCKALTSLNLSNFNTSKVTHFHYMFNGCESLQFLNLSNFKTTNAQIISYMFKNCKSLTSLVFPNLDSSKVTESVEFLLNCNSLKYINLEKSKITSQFANNINNYINSEQNICTHSQKLITIIFLQAGFFFLSITPYNLDA